MFLSWFFFFTLHLSAAQKAPIPQPLKEIETKYSKSKTVEAKFSQKVQTAISKKPKETEGTVYLSTPDKIRWETQKPDSEKNTLVGDGKLFWFYTPPFQEGERGQVIVKKSTEVQSKVASALLSGRFSSAPFTKITQKSSREYELIPAKGSAGDVKVVLVQIEPQKAQITGVVLKYKNGNKSEIHLKEVALGKAFDSKLFDYTPPLHTDIITE